jgi:lipopolysaccharide exporter
LKKDAAWEVLPQPLPGEPSLGEGLKGAPLVQNLGSRTLGGALWQGGERLYRQGLFLIRAVVLGRLLSPHDFGLVGLGELSIYFLGVLTYLGFESALVQQPHLESRMLHTAWWVKLGRSLLIAALLWLGAPSIAALAHEPQAAPVLQALAVITFLSGFASISFTLLSRELQFKALFKFEALGLTLDLAVAIAAAVIWRNVWALVLGSLTGTLCRLALSYRLHPYKPRWVFDLKAARQLFQFGKWLLLSAMMFFIISKGTDALSGFLFGAGALGLYQMSSRFALLPTNHLGETFLGVMFPAYSLIQEDRPRLTAVFYKVLQVTTFLVFPLSTLMAVAGGPVLTLLLGPQWLGVAGLVPWLALGGALQALLRTGSPLFLASGQPKLQFAMDLASTLGILLLVYPLSHFFGLKGLAAAYAGGISLGLPLWWAYVRQQLGAKSRDLALSLVPALLGSLLLGGIILIPWKIWQLTLSKWPDLGWLLLLGLVGSIFYLIFIYLAERGSVAYRPIRATLNLVQVFWQRENGAAN